MDREKPRVFCIFAPRRGGVSTRGKKIAQTAFRKYKIMVSPGQLSKSIFAYRFQFSFFRFSPSETYRLGCLGNLLVGGGEVGQLVGNPENPEFSVIGGGLFSWYFEVMRRQALLIMIVQPV